MNTKLVMGASAAVMGVTGLALSFFPQELSSKTGLQTDNYIVLQLLGALYFAFAALNWMAKGSIIGGIYGKPIVAGNFAHFLIGCLALIKANTVGISASALIGCTIIYALFAIVFGYIMFTHPSPKSN